MLDLNDTLQIINNISGLLDITKILEQARKFKAQTPQTFI